MIKQMSVGKNTDVRWVGFHPLHSEFFLGQMDRGEKLLAVQLRRKNKDCLSLNVPEVRLTSIGVGGKQTHLTSANIRI
jgi:hypothetical protein